MTATTDTTTGARRKLAAVLAGGLVLGVGSAATLASWNDSESATASFTAGTFVFQGSTDGTTYSDHNYANAAALTFSTPVANLSPGDVVAAPFAVRLGAGTTHHAYALIQPAAVTGTTSNLTYEVIDTGASFGCTAATTGTTVVASAPMVSGYGYVYPTKGASATAPGTPENLCFKVTAGAGIAQGQTATVTWGINAYSYAG